MRFGVGRVVPWEFAGGSGGECVFVSGGEVGGVPAQASSSASYWACEWPSNTTAVMTRRAFDTPPASLVP